MLARLRSKGLSKAALFSATLAGMLLISGCSSSYWPQILPESPSAAQKAKKDEIDTGAVAPVPVNKTQLQSIMNDVSRVAHAADAALDSEILRERFTGDALMQRSANYKIRKKVSDYGTKLAPISAEMLQYQLVQSTQTWPRTLLVTVASKTSDDVAAAEAKNTAANSEKSEQTKQIDDVPALALLLTQQTAQENYLVNRVVALRRVEMPPAAPAKDGTALLSDDIDSLVLKPSQVGQEYAAILREGMESPAAAKFSLDSDPLLENYGLAWVKNTKEKSAADNKTQNYSVQAEQGKAPVISLSTGAGGALVATTVLETQIADSAGSRFRPQAEGAVSALSGLSGQQEKIVRQVAHQLLFYVPSKTSAGKIQLLGVTSELVGAGK